MKPRRLELSMEIHGGAKMAQLFCFFFGRCIDPRWSGSLCTWSALSIGKPPMQTGSTPPSMTWMWLPAKRRLALLNFEKTLDKHWSACLEYRQVRSLSGWTQRCTRNNHYDYIMYISSPFFVTKFKAASTLMRPFQMKFQNHQTPTPELHKFHRFYRFMI